MSLNLIKKLLNLIKLMAYIKLKKILKSKRTGPAIYDRNYLGDGWVILKCVIKYVIKAWNKIYFFFD